MSLVFLLFSIQTGSCYYIRYYVKLLVRNVPLVVQQALVKNKLLIPTLSVVFPLMASPPSEDDDFDEEEDDDEVEDGTEASRPCAVASQVRFRLGLQLLFLFL